MNVKNRNIYFTVKSTVNPLLINNNIIPQKDNTKYLSIHLNNNFNWAYYIKIKC
jgi:hypothetical protein